MTTFAIIGFGELGCALAEGLGRSGDHVIRAYAPRRGGRGAEAALADRIERARASTSESLDEAVAGAGVVLSAVPASASLEVAEEVAPRIGRDSYFVDLTSAPLEEIRAAAEIIDRSGARYVDAAVLGAVAAIGADVPIAASGAGARDWCALARDCGLAVEFLEGPAGHATLLKLLRSVYMKGREALIVEMMHAAWRHGLDEQVARSIAGPGEQVAFSALADRVLCSLALHARRRAGELLNSSEVLAEGGVDPVATRAGAEALAGLAQLDLDEAFDHRRPVSGRDVLAKIDELSVRGSAANGS